ncbi:hypothetical protein [Aeoliella sp.]|uniref:hypothetical protein n=1 Tax=Aeoliella sp. TaxID=2795800 RepID=UPI003CCC326A
MIAQALDTLDSTRIDYLPTPAEISDACASIRENWSLNERRRRFVGPELPDEIPETWSPPTIDTSGFRLSMNRLASD